MIVVVVTVVVVTEIVEDFELVIVIIYCYCYCYYQVRTLRERCPLMNIQVDGGIGPDNIDLVAAAGANMIVAGSSIFKSAPEPVIALLRR